MARFKDHEEALRLRKQGLSYSQIKKILKINKSTLSYWLRKYPLSKERIRELKDVNEIRIERFRETMKRKKEKRLDTIYKFEKKSLLPLSKREMYIAGLLLYCGEGSKFKTATLSVANTDPAVIKFFICWLNKCLSVPRKKIRIDLQLYADMNTQKEIQYWADILKLSLSQFSRPYIKKNLSTIINHKGNFGHGTCNARIGGVKLLEKTLMGIKAIMNNIT